METRIAFISEHASPLAVLGGKDSGGQNVYVLKLACELAAKGLSIDIYTRRDNADLKTVVPIQNGVRVIHVDAGPPVFVEKEQLLGFMPAFADWMEQYIIENNLQYEISHAHFFMSGMVASILKHRMALPYVITFHALGIVRQLHQNGADRFPGERNDIEKFLVRDADHIIAECPQDKSDLVQYYNACHKSISIVPCGYCEKELYPVDKLHARTLLGFVPNSKIILHVGRMVPRKGVDNIVRALRYVESDIEFKLVIVGGESETPDEAITPELKVLRSVAEQERVLHKIIFAGSKSRKMLKYYYSAADVFVTTPWYEPFGITPLEAMACATPVIGADVGGIKFSIKNNRSGFLVPPKDPQSLANVINAMLSNQANARKMGLYGLRRVKKLFTWEKVATSVLTVYAKIGSIEGAAASEGKVIQLRTLTDMFSKPFSSTILSPGA